MVDPAQVRVEQVAQVRHAVLEHRDAVDAQSPGEALVDLGVDAAVPQHVLVHHAAAEDLQPVLALAEADLAARAAALDVDLHRRRGEGEEARPETHADLRHLEERLAELLEHPLQVGERRALIDHQALDLVEHRRMGLVEVRAVGASGADDPDRRLLRQHRAHLHRARVGAQKLALALVVRREEERVVHLAGGMAGREVELGEVEVVAFDVRPFGDREAHVGEDGDNLVHHLADRVDPAGLDSGQSHRQRDVERLALELGCERGLLQHAAAHRERFGHRVLQGIDRRPVGLAFVGRELAEGGQQGRDRALLAEGGDAHGFERRLVGRALDGGEGFVFEGGEI